MLKFDDERSRRARANARALRRMILRLTTRLSPEKCNLQPAFRTLFMRSERGITMRDTVNQHDITTLTNTSGSLCTIIQHPHFPVSSVSSLSSLSAATTVAASSSSSVFAQAQPPTHTNISAVDKDALVMQVRRLLETTEHQATANALDLCSDSEVTSLPFAKRSQFITQTKDVPFGQSPYDLPITRYLQITRDWLVALCECMLTRGYSLSYLKSTLKLIRSDSRGTFPLVPSEYAAFLRSIVSTKQRFFATRTLQSDGVYTMDEQLFQRMRLFCVEYVRTACNTGHGIEFRDGQLVLSAHSYLPNELRFCLIFVLMFHTGKRCSDLSVLTIDDLRKLLRDDDLAIRIPKTDRVGRISMKHVEEPDKLREFLDWVVQLINRDDKLATNLLPFDVFRQRRTLTKMFEFCYEAIVQHPKPKGLSFHSLRRRKAGRYFKQGEQLETIRECLDHAHTSMTNTYINKYLLSTSTS